MTTFAYTKGLHEIRNGVYAYLQPDGSWGWNNAGLVVDGAESLLIDTLFDLELTREMLTAMGTASPTAASSIDVLVNTHANGDHTYGNELVHGAEIIASKACAEELAEMPPQMLADLLKAAPDMGDLGAYLSSIFGRFKFDGITLTPPTRTFEKRLDLTVGSQEVRLIEVGPCHTRGDVMVYVPGERVLFSGDILFIGGTPIMWTGPVGNWLKACDLIMDLDVDVIVPGHGPICDKQGVRATKDYFEWLTAEARKRYDAGMTAAEAASDIQPGVYASWSDPERIAINIDALFREFANDASPANPIALFSQMATLAKGK